MNRSIIVLSCILSAVFLAFGSDAQESAQIRRIGFLGSAAPQDILVRAFREELKKLGYEEGRNITLEYRSTATDLVKIPVDVIVADGATWTRAAKDATGVIPIVMTSSTDPVGLGFVASLARPGGNITGLTSVSGELGGKTLELLKEIVPRVTRVAVPAPPNQSTEIFLKETETAARALGVQLIPLMVRGAEDFDRAFGAATKARANALLVRISVGTSSAHRKQFTELAAQSRLPAIYTASIWTVNGGLISYGADRIAMYRRAATYVDKIFKGSKSADLPVEAPTKYELVINLKTAKQIGLAIPANVLARADKVIR